MGAPTEFTVDCSKSGPGDVTVNITSAKRKTVPVSINDNGDDTYTGQSLSEALFFADHGENMLCTKIVLNVRNNFCTRHVLPMF